MPNGSIIAFDISILLRLARLDMLDRDVAALGPFQKLVTDVFRAVVDPNACWLAAPFDDLGNLVEPDGIEPTTSSMPLTRDA